MIKYISFDPGLSTGVVCWDEKGEPTTMEDMNQIELDTFLIRLESLTSEILEEGKNIPEVFIIEEYRIYPHVKHYGSKVETVQVIGQIKAFARKHSIKIVEQKAAVKNIAALWSGMKISLGHMPDWQAAYLHGYYYLHNIGVIKARVLDEK